MAGTLRDEDEAALVEETRRLVTLGAAEGRFDEMGWASGCEDEMELRELDGTDAAV